MEGKMVKEYLGDGLYADYDGYHIVLTAENGVQVLETVYLDPDVWRALKAYAAKIYLERGTHNT